MPTLKNLKHEKFIQFIIKGLSQRQAYKKAFNVNYADEAIDSKASALFNSDKVQQRYKELMDKLEEKTIMSAKERMEWLTKVVNGSIKENYNVFDKESGKPLTLEKEANINDKIKAVDTLNKMSGEYITKVEGNMNISYEESLREVADSDEY